jgi:flagellar basal-body rod protein FlgC
MALFSSLDIAASGMTAQRLRQDIVANNIANADTTRTPEGGPFRRHLVVFEPRTESVASGSPAGSDWNTGLLPMNGVRAVAIVQDSSPFKIVHDPGHPDADANGDVQYPNVDPIIEMVDLMESNRAYEANFSVFETTKQLLLRTISMGR